MKLFLLLTIILSFTLASFSQSNPTVDKPQITFKNRKYGNKKLRTKILKTIIEPLLKETSKPIKEIIIDYCPEDSDQRVIGRGCSDKLTPVISIWINGFPILNADTAFNIYARIEINKDGSFGKDEYKRLLPQRFYEIPYRIN